MNTLVVNVMGREKRCALLKNNRLEKLVIEQPEQQSIVGGIYFGVVEKILPGLNAAFINIGLEKNGFLHRDKLPSFAAKREDKSISSYLHQGERILVQVEKDATGDKGPRLTGMVEFPGEMLVYSPKGGSVAVSKKIEDSDVREKWRQFGYAHRLKEEGILFRTACIGQDEKDVLAELVWLRGQYEQIMHTAKSMKKPGLIFEKNSFLDRLTEDMRKMASGQVIVDTLEMKNELLLINQNEQIEILFHQAKENIFSTYQIEYEPENLLKRVVWLENGAYLVFDEAEALTIIDVNTGKFSGKQERHDTVLKTNQLAAEEIARQIRLRDLSGMILVDFIDMKNVEDRNRVQRKLEATLGFDEKRTRIVGYTSLGVLQMTRKKQKVSISETLTSTCKICEGTGKVLSAETIAFQLERELLEQRGNAEEAILIETTDEVKDILIGEQKVHQRRLEEIIGLKLHFSVKEASKPFYAIKQIGNLADIKGRAD